MLEDILKLMFETAHSRPAGSLSPALDPLFDQLAQAQSTEQAAQIEDQIWALWMEHPADSAREMLERARQTMAEGNFTLSGTLLDRIVEDYPDYAEAWNKRATLRFLQGRDGESLRDIEQSLRLEPRHFGAVCGFAQICLRQDREELALFALQRAQALHPNLESVNEAIARLASRRKGLAH
ncbi:MAG TPA: hypothetical protein VFB54_19295 [Burkholderiales bacterium]|nr:hypothetical protein [Burkholderiales bacterium]